MRRFRLPALAAAIALTLSACMAPTSREVRPVDDEPLLDKDWRLVATPNDSNLPTQGAGAAVLRFSPSRFSMAGPCNNHTGGWAREGDQLRIFQALNRAAIDEMPDYHKGPLHWRLQRN